MKAQFQTFKCNNSPYFGVNIQDLKLVEKGGIRFLTGREPLLDKTVTFAPGDVIYFLKREKNEDPLVADIVKATINYLNDTFEPNFMEFTKTSERILGVTSIISENCSDFLKLTGNRQIYTREAVEELLKGSLEKIQTLIQNI